VADDDALAFARRLWEAAATIYEAILLLPFNRELTAGTLDPAIFRFYIFQDSLYLADFARALAITGSRAPMTDDALTFFRFAEGAIVVEQALHEIYFDEFGVPVGLDQSPTCAHYTSFLLAAASQRSYEEAVAALLPCFWIYREVGHTIHRQAAPDNPYRRWIDTYAGDEYSAAVDRAIAETAKAAGQASRSAEVRMVDAFVTSARLEWMFWDSAYRLETWPP
jgi:thiaminase/transcriptional activator TenA